MLYPDVLLVLEKTKLEPSFVQTPTAVVSQRLTEQ